MASERRDEVSTAGPSTAQSTPAKPSLKDFEIIKEIGEGSFSVVYAARVRDNALHVDLAALKMCLKKQIIREKKTKAVYRERAILARLSTIEHQHPFIVCLYCTFQDTDHLYFALSLAMSDLLQVILSRPERRLSLADSRFYAAELFSALEHIHSLSIIHRDVKPENTLVSRTGHLLLSDFGSAVDRTVPDDVKPEGGSEGRVRRSSFVGTAQYVSPEVLRGDIATPACDFWAFGVTLYQLLTGKHAFHDESEYLIYKRIQGPTYKFPEEFDATAKDLVKKLLVVDLSERLDASRIRSHEFFKEVKLETLADLEAPPFKPHFTLPL